MLWRVRYHEAFVSWWDNLDAEEQESVEVVVLLLKAQGPHLGHPYSSQIKGSRYPMRELRIQHQGQPYRILYIFDKERSAILMVGGNKTGDDRWYEREVPRAEKLYDEYLEE